MESEMIQSVGTVSGLLSNYGPTIVILAVFIVIFIFIMIIFIKISQKNLNQIIESNKKYTDQVMKQNDEFLSVIMKNEHKYESEDIVEIFVKLDRLLKNQCMHTLEKISCDRIAIYVFHNGMTSSHGLPFFKMSCICEWIERGSGIGSKVMNHTNIPINLFEPIVSGLYDRGEVILEDVELIKQSDPFTYSFVSSGKVRTCLFVSIYDSNNRIMGFIISEYNSLEDCTKQKSSMNILKALCGKLQPTLEYSNYQSKKF